MDLLIKAIKAKKSRVSFTFPNKKEYWFNISYPKNKDGIIVNTNTNIIDPYKKAQNTETLFIKHYNKLLLTKPTMLIFVINHWYNRDFNCTLRDVNQTYFRAVARRVFMKLGKSRQKYNKIFRTFTNKTLTISNIVNKLSGLLFIIDNSIDRNDNLFSPYFYLNPNADNLINVGNFSTMYSKSRKNLITPIDLETFKYDNY